MADDIQIRLAKSTDYDSVLDFLRTHYYPEEPLTIGTEPKEQETADEEFNMSNIEHGIGLIALERAVANTEGKIVGVVLAGPKDPHEAEHLFEEANRLGATKWGNIVRFLAVVERATNVYKRYGVTRVLHAHVLVVDRHLRGRAIGQRLMKELMRVGRQRRFPLLTTDCTSLYSANLCDHLGMECVNTLHYADYLGVNGKPVFQPPEPHDCTKSYATRLNAVN